MKIYHATSENLILPRDHPLSKVVYSYDWWKRHVKNRQERVKELNDLGFVWERLQSDWNIALESLVCFKVSREDIFWGSLPLDLVRLAAAGSPLGDAHARQSAIQISHPFTHLMLALLLYALLCLALICSALPSSSLLNRSFTVTWTFQGITWSILTTRRALTTPSPAGA